jgi:dCTP deaminase
MPESARIHPLLDDRDDSGSGFTTGILPFQAIKEAIYGTREILAEEPIGDDQIQPASIDLRLGTTAYRVRASFLPGASSSVRHKIDALAMYDIDLTKGAILEKDGVYIVPLLERVALKKRTSAAVNPKSSTGRLDIFARLIADHGTEFDRIREGYKGSLFVELSPRTFPVRVCAGSRLVQMRIRRGSPPQSDAALRRLHDERPLVDNETVAANIRGGIPFTVDVKGIGGTDVIGYKARKNTGVIDVDLRDHYDPRDFWDPVSARGGRGLILDPNDFYILASRESVTVPPDYAAEMLAYDTLVGEFRVHYAGFFDPGFGAEESGGGGSRAVLEVRSHEVPFLIEDGQVVGRLVYERLTQRPERLYGSPLGSHYQRQGLKLSKHFKAPV